MKTKSLLSIALAAGITLSGAGFAPTVRADDAMLQPVVNEYKVEDYVLNDLSMFDLDRYDNAKYMQYIWDSNITYNESALILENEDGTLDPVKLLFDLDKLVSVRSADLKTLYEEGKDYKIENGKLVIVPETEGGSIPALKYSEVFFDSKPTKEGTYQCTTVKGKYQLYVEAGALYDHQIAVTYYHEDKGDYTVPVTQSGEFTGVIGKLERGESVNIACLGDSISNGSNASGFFGDKLAPYMPSYFGLVGDYIQAKYGYQKICLYESGNDYVDDKENEPVRIKMTNFSVGGKQSGWGVEQRKAVAAVDPDLVILGFGMNDGSAYFGEQEYYENLLAIIDHIRLKNPQCEFAVLATMLPNAEISWSDGGITILGNQEKYLPWLQKLAQEQENVALVDVTTLHKEYLEKKNYRDMTGNNVNHPNDFFVRVYAQAIVKTIFG